MKMPRTSRRNRAAVLASVTTALCMVGIAGGSPAAAAVASEHYTSPEDRGGVNGWTEIRNYNSHGTGYWLYYRAEFIAPGEYLKLMDNVSDGSEAHAVVKVYNRSGKLVDTDTFDTGTKATYNLGTPDGSGDVPEGYKIKITVSGGGFLGDTITCYA